MGMVIPPLRSPENPDAPPWAAVRMPPEQAAHLFRSLVMFYGYDDHGDKKSRTKLGTGVIVGRSNQLAVLTTSHGFTEWTDAVSPPAPHALRGITGDGEDYQKRLSNLVFRNRIRAITSFGSAKPRFLTIHSMSGHTKPRELDCAVVQLELPEECQAEYPAAVPVDTDRFPFEEPVILAGFPEAQWSGDPSDPFDIGQLSQTLTVRAGYVAELQPPGERFKCSMFRVKIPTLGGMSGGPMLVLRKPPEHPGFVLPTLAGLVSFGTVEEETWVTPIGHAYHLTVKTLDHGTLPFGECVKRDMISSYGHNAKRWKVEWDADRRNWTTR
jgi:hypothetical protein